MSQSQKIGNGRHIFTNEEDLKILRKVVADMPMVGQYKEIPRKWQQIEERLNFGVKSGSIRKRFDLLFEKFIEDDTAGLKSSGTEEDYNEKVQLCQDIKDYTESHKNSFEPSTAKSKSEDELKRQLAVEVREEAMCTLSGSSSPTSSTSKKAKVDPLAKYLEKKAKSEQEAKEKELEDRRAQREFEKVEKEKDRKERREERKLEQRKLDLMEEQMKNQNTFMIEVIKLLKK